MLVQVIAPHFTAGMLLKNDVVYHAAPILRWAVGKRWSEVRRRMNQDWKLKIIGGDIK